MRNAWLGSVVLCALSITFGCRARSPDWNGTWKLNPSKSSFHGSVFSVSISADGEYRYEGGLNLAFRCDGKDWPIGKNHTRACVKSSATVLDLIEKENGVKTTASHWELSVGGKVLTLMGTAFRPSGPVITAQIVASRLSGSDGFAGQWRDMSYVREHADLTLRLDSQTLHIDYPNAGQYVDAPLNGSDASVLGPHAPKGVTYEARLVGRREISTLTKRNGKILTQGSLELGFFGRVLTESWWGPGQPASKGTLVYERK